MALSHSLATEHLVKNLHEAQIGRLLWLPYELSETSVFHASSWKNAGYIVLISLIPIIDWMKTDTYCHYHHYCKALNSRARSTDRCLSPRVAR